MSSKALNLYLGSLKEDWLNYCDKRNLKSGEELRNYIEERLKEESKSSDLKPVVKQKLDSVDEDKKRRYEILLTPSEITGINLAAKAENSSPRKWTVNTIRSALTLEPQFTINEISALWESSSQLRAIGRNLNQLVKYLNSVGYAEQEKTALTIEHIDKLKVFIDDHTERVSKLIHASSERSILVTRNKT